jgi:xanthine dehydrogenase molybdenum-binding subunit
MARFTVNGRDVAVSDDHPHLLAALREELELISPKDGCSPSGQCGCCTVLIDGKAQVSCQVPLTKAEGRGVLTLEGLSTEERDRFARVFASTGALQCGFCTPGIIMRVKALLDRRGSGLAREDAARHLGAHLCRCTGYVKILDAVESLAKGESPTADLPDGIGSSGIKYESCELALGDRPYIDDLRVPGMLHAALRLADHARAEVISIDTVRATNAPGVQAVFTADDVPGRLRVGLIHKDWPVFIPPGGRTSYLGDVLAIVVADSRELARAAATLVDVTYRPLAPLTDPVSAITTDNHDPAVWGTDDNILSAPPITAAMSTRPWLRQLT